jgi:hypothetical protein
MNRIPDDTPMSLAIDPVPPREGPEIYILRLQGAERFTFTVYSSAIFGIWVHWSGDRSSPHYTDTKRCQGCQEEQPMRWKGFLHAYCIEKRQDVFLELTPGSARALQEQLGAGESLRGQGLFVQRTKGNNGRLLIRVLNAHPDSAKLPPEIDPQASLMTLWGIKPQSPKGGREFPTASRNGVHKVDECL